MEEQISGIAVKNLNDPQTWMESPQLLLKLFEIGLRPIWWMAGPEQPFGSLGFVHCNAMYCSIAQTRLQSLYQCTWGKKNVPVYLGQKKCTSVPGAGNEGIEQSGTAGNISMLSIAAAFS